MTAIPRVYATLIGFSRQAAKLACKALIHVCNPHKPARTYHDRMAL